MALLKYFKWIDLAKQETIEAVLPNPEGPLSVEILQSSIEADNLAVTQTMMGTNAQLTFGEQSKSKSRGTCSVFTAKEKLGRTAAEYSVM